MPFTLHAREQADGFLEVHLHGFGCASWASLPGLSQYQSRRGTFSYLVAAESKGIGGWL